jgi:tetratricopeptide (TPR) repeat protein
MRWTNYISVLGILLYLGHSLSLAQNTEKAKKHYDNGRQAYLKFTSRDYQEAIASYQKALSDDSNFAPAYAGLAEAYALWGYEAEKNHESGQTYFDRALENGKKAVLKNSKLAAAHRALAQALRTVDSKEAGQKVYEELHAALALDSLDAESYYLLWLHTENDSTESPLIRIALKLNDNFFQSHYGIGVLYAKQKKFDQAIGHYKKCIGINAKNYLPHYALGNAYSQMKKYDLAVPEYESAIKLNDRLAEAHFYLGLAYYYLDKNKDAKKHLQKYLEMAPGTTYRTQVEDILKDLK